MTLQELLDRLESIEREAGVSIAGAADLAALADVRTQLVGRKAGALTGLLHAIPELGADRAAAGKALNTAKARIDAALAERESALAATRPSGPSLDLTMPGRTQWRGAKHPVTVVIEEIEDIFRELGFTVVAGPEAETEWYNFTSLNFPPNHPAMDLHDTLYLRDDVLLRTHTSPVQMRTLQKYPPPIRILAPGNVYRRDFFDPSHAPAFAQIEGLSVDEGVSFVDLKATLTHFARRFFSRDTKTRFRPSYFPFTEPSAEMDVQCGVCKGSGCPTCKQSGWIEILGSGMVHPRVLEQAGVDAERFTGWAFGLGPARTALARYGIPDIRVLYDSDMRFLEQFAG